MTKKTYTELKRKEEIEKLKKNTGIIEYLSGRDLYKLYYDQKLTQNEREAIYKRLNEADEKFEFTFTGCISNFKNGVKEWEYTFGTKLNHSVKEDLMEIKKGERLWLYYLESLCLRTVNNFYSSNGNCLLLDYPEFVPNEESPNPLIELMNIFADIKYRIQQVENWLTEHGWVKKESIVIDRNVS